MASIRTGSTTTLIESLFVDGSASGMTDEQLLERFVSRRDAAAVYAFEALVQRHGPMVLSVCRNFLGDPHDADDAFQATFLVLARKAPFLRVPSRLGPWLHGVSLRAARKVKSRRSRLERLIRRVEARARIIVSSKPREETDRSEEAAMLHEEIGRLPDRYRDPVVLCCLEGLTHAEAARRLGWPVGTVGVRLMRARERLRTRLTTRGMGPGIALAGPLVPVFEPLPYQSVIQTARAAVNFALKNGTTSFAVRSEVARIALDVLRSVAFHRTTSAIGAVFICGLLAAGTVLALQPSAQRPKIARPTSSSESVVERTSEARSILFNGGFEDGDPKGPAPDSWEKGARIAGVEYLWDRNVAHGGRASLHLKKTVQRYFPIAQWFQEVKRTGATPRLKVSAFVKAKKTTKAILDVQFAGGEGDGTHHWAVYIGAKEAGDPPVTHDWKRYEGVVEIPGGTEKIIVAAQIYGPGDAWFDDVVADYTEDKATDPVALDSKAAAPERPDADVADIALVERNAAQDPRKRYLLIDPASERVEPAAGYRLLILLPGGDGSAEFRTFCRRIAKNALPPGYLVAELVAVAWTPEQARRIVWPTATDEMPEVQFTTEQFVDSVIADVAREKKIDARYVFVLGWSSGGPPAYAASRAPRSRVTGSFVAMSVFRPERLPRLENSACRAYYLYHSPDDRLIPYSMAKEAADALRSSGSAVQLRPYDGGHGWRGAVYDEIRAGIDWLEHHSQLKP
jgi:RNA polymerase sigma-70 factor (ECF subfamily)